MTEKFAMLRHLAQSTYSALRVVNKNLDMAARDSDITLTIRIEGTGKPGDPQQVYLNSEIDSYHPLKPRETEDS